MGLELLKRLDLLVLALALPIFLGAGLPFLGWLTAAVAWVVQTVIKEASEKRALAIARDYTGKKRDSKAAIADMRKVAGLTAGSMIARGWLCAIAIFGGYLIAGQEDQVGLTAAVLVLICFSTYFSTTMVLRPFRTEELPS